MKKRTSIIWDLTDEEFIKMVKQAISWKGLLANFNLQNKGGNNKTIKKRVEELGLDTSHFMGRIQASNFTRKMNKETFIEKHLTENSNISRNSIKRYVVEFELLDYKCTKCENIGEWMDEPITLQLEHINGVSNDNRLENLCFLCPNCHSQTKSYAGKSGGKKGRRKHINQCNKCEKEISSKATHCKKCRVNNIPDIITWPDKKELERLVWEKPLTKLSKELGVCDRTITNRCKKLNIPTPSMGYWAKIKKRDGGI